ncbi:hypothetical protein B0H17DRAFT_590560 [Mycena rosella]|uniref:Uncharacterized protein n=1 Tax=Mycena rosella TaxID=1033263 RepID=A0AAD7BJM9_MYCRO|nr:hypothetical protein B0H17DRAFT_590560 [Mycena rosella]
MYRERSGELSPALSRYPLSFSLPHTHAPQIARLTCDVRPLHRRAAPVQQPTHPTSPVAWGFVNDARRAYIASSAITSAGADGPAAPFVVRPCPHHPLRVPLRSSCLSSPVVAPRARLCRACASPCPSPSSPHACPCARRGALSASPSVSASASNRRHAPLCCMRARRKARDTRIGWRGEVRTRRLGGFRIQDPALGPSARLLFESVPGLIASRRARTRASSDAQPSTNPCVIAPLTPPRQHRSRLRACPPNAPARS